MKRLLFGANVDPTAAGLTTARAVARRADELGFDLVGIQDHPYVDRFVDTWALMAALIVQTERVTVFPNVANLPLRSPAMLAKAAATLDLLGRGRFVLGLGSGANPAGARAMGGPERTGGEALAALEEAIRLIRAFWSGERTLDFDGRFYSVRGLHPGPAPFRPIPIWLGVLKPRGLALTGRVADGWTVSVPYAPPTEIPEMQRRIDEAAAEAGRDPADIVRLYNVMGVIADGPADELLHGPPAHWIEQLTEFAVELGFDAFVFWPRGDDPVKQIERFAAEVLPGVREAVGA